jgi:hypothetical protein
MAFEPFVFNRTIPPTVPSAAASTSFSVLSAGTTSNTSVAASLAVQLGALIDTATYLHDVIQRLNPCPGISVDSGSNPVLASALGEFYNGQTPPAMSLKMYSYQLDAELGCAQVNLAAGTDSSVQANPFQYQALMTANKAFEAQTASSGVFAAQSALLLRRLKSDVITHSNMQQQLLQYPAAFGASSSSAPSTNVIQASTVDVSSDVASLVQNHVDQTGQIYSSMYQVVAQPDPVASDVANVVSMLSTVAVPDLIRMNALLQMTQQGDLSQSAQDLSVGVSAFVYPQMLTQSSGMLFQLDQVMQMAVSSASKMSNSVGSAMTALNGAMAGAGAMVGVIRSMKQGSSTQTTGPLAGMPLNNGSQSGLAMSSSMPSSLSSLGFSSGVNEVSSLMSFSINSGQSANSLHQDAFARLTARVRGDSGGLTQVLAVASSLASLTSLVSAFINEQQSSSAISSQSASTQLATVGRILASSQTGNGTSYTVQGGVVTITPPAVPAPTSGVQTVFAQSGIQTSLTGLTQTLQ